MAMITDNTCVSISYCKKKFIIINFKYYEIIILLVI